jgi:undecaprenyl-diphosphatase
MQGAAKIRTSAGTNNSSQGMEEYLSGATSYGVPIRLLPFSYSSQGGRPLPSLMRCPRRLVSSTFVILLGFCASISVEGAPSDSSGSYLDMASLGLLQNPSVGFLFALDPLEEAALIGGDLVLYGGSLYLQSKKPMPDKTAVDAATIPVFDRIYPSNPSATLSSVGDDLAVASVALPLSLLPGRSGEEIITLGVMDIETLGLAYSIDSLLKSAVVRYRPYAYSTSTPANFSNSDITASFPSLDATIAFSSAVFTGYVFDQFNPDSNLKTIVWASGLTVATAVSILIVASGDHFVSDVVAGSAIGAAIGFLIPFLHERFHPIKTNSNAAVSSFELVPTAGGILVRLSLKP